MATKQTKPTNLVVTMVMMMFTTTKVYDPCSDAKANRSDGFIFGLAFSTRNSFFNQTKLSPCNRCLPLLGSNAQLAVFRPKVDELSLLTINSTTFSPVMAGGFMVAFAGRKYAARSSPVLVADNANIITGFTLGIQ